MIDVLFYTAPNGKKPVAEYLKSLDKAERADLADALLRVHKFGLSAVTTQAIGGKLWEIKANAQRAFYVLMTADSIVVLHAYMKKSQKAPAAELATARARMKELLDE